MFELVTGNDDMVLGLFDFWFTGCTMISTVFIFLFQRQCTLLSNIPATKHLCAFMYTFPNGQILLCDLEVKMLH